MVMHKAGTYLFIAFGIAAGFGEHITLFGKDSYVSPLVPAPAETEPSGKLGTAECARAAVDELASYARLPRGKVFERSEFPDLFEKIDEQTRSTRAACGKGLGAMDRQERRAVDRAIARLPRTDR
jgi:hypothetical protein